MKFKNKKRHIMAEDTEKKAEETEPKAAGKEDKEGETEKEKDGKEVETEKEESETDKLTAQLSDMKDKYLRLSAEFDNYRKRTLKERMELTKTAGEGLLTDLLPVVDNLERALASMEQSDNVEAIREGIRLIHAGFKDFLTQHGVKEIECKNHEFNTDEHDGVTRIPAPTPDLKGKVVDCIQKGYKLNDKVIRFAKVVVGE